MVVVSMRQSTILCIVHWERFLVEYQHFVKGFVAMNLYIVILKLWKTFYVTPKKEMNWNNRVCVCGRLHRTLKPYRSLLSIQKKSPATKRISYDLLMPTYFIIIYIRIKKAKYIPHIDLKSDSSKASYSQTKQFHVVGKVHGQKHL